MLGKTTRIQGQEKKENETILVGKAIMSKDIRGGVRLQLLKLHRLIEFEQTFTRYLESRATAAQVQYGAKLMLKYGLPKLR